MSLHVDVTSFSNHWCHDFSTGEGLSASRPGPGAHGPLTRTPAVPLTPPTGLQGMPSLLARGLCSPWDTVLPGGHCSPRGTQCRWQNLIYRQRCQGQGSCLVTISVCRAQYDLWLKDRTPNRRCFCTDWTVGSPRDPTGAALLPQSERNLRLEPASLCGTCKARGPEMVPAAGHTRWPPRGLSGLTATSVALATCLRALQTGARPGSRAHPWTPRPDSHLLMWGSGLVEVSADSHSFPPTTLLRWSTILQGKQGIHLWKWQKM